MAEDMNLQINITGQNDTASSFISVDSQMNALNQLAETVTRTFQAFMDTITNAFTNAGRSAQELTRPLSELGTDASRASELARSVGEVGASAQEATRQIENMNQAAGRTSHAGQGASGHGESGGLFGMQGQMDTMYAGMAMGAAALPLVGAIKSSVDAYGQFSQSMANVNSMMGLSGQGLQKLSNQVLDLSKNVPGGPVALANALYGVVGAGVPAADQMDVLSTSAKAATAGQTDVSTATGALISVMNSYGLKGKDVAKISDQMFAANAAGAMTFDSFARSIGNVAGPAAQAGVSFGQVAAATAALTNQGMSAQRATEGLRAFLVGIMSPTAGAAKEAKKLGIEWDANALKSKGMTGMINEAMKATHGNSQELKKLIPNIAAWTAAVDLGGKGADSFKQAMDTMNKSAGATDKAMGSQEQGYQEKMNKMKAATQSAEIAFANGFIPVLTDAISKVASMADAFSKLSPNTQKIIGDVTLGAAAFLSIGSAMFMSISAIGGVIKGFSTVAGAVSSGIGALKTFATAAREVGIAEAFMDAMNPVGWVILIGTAVVGIGILIYSHWSQIKAFLSTTWSAISTATSTAWNGIKTFFSGLWTSISQTATNVWNGLINFFKQWGTLLLAVFVPVIGIPAFLAQHWSQVTAIASTIWNSVINTIKSIWNRAISWIQGAGQAFVNIIVNAFNWMYNHNYYFQDLVDFIRKAWTTIQDDAKTVWDTLTTWLSNAWNGIKSVASQTWNGFVRLLSDVWDAIKSVAEAFWNREKTGFQNIWSAIVSIAKSVWNGLTSFFTGLWNGISSVTSNAWSGIKNTISNLVNSAINALKGPFNGLGSFFSGLWGQAEQWGANLINMMAQGIKNAAGAVGNAVKSVASGIAKVLGFHSPAEEGPGADADVWMPNLMKMFTTDIQKYTPQFQAAISNMALGMKTGITTPLTQNISHQMAMPSGSGTKTGPTIIVYASGNITKNEEHLGDIVSTAIWNKAKMQGKI